MYKDNKRVRDDWIGKNMQYLIGRTGLFKHYQGEKFRPWSGAGYKLPDRYTNLQIDGNSGRPCAHLTTKCEKPVDIDQCSWVDQLEAHLQSALDARDGLSNTQFSNSDDFIKMIQLLEASYFLMNQNETGHLYDFEFIQRIDLSEDLSASRVRRARTEEEKADDKIDVLGPYPEHSGGNFRKVDPEFTTEFFHSYINRFSHGKATRRNSVVEFLVKISKSMLNRIPVIREKLLFCSDRSKRSNLDTSKVETESKGSRNPMSAMKLLLRGSIKGMDKIKILTLLDKTK